MVIGYIPIYLLAHPILFTRAVSSLESNERASAIKSFIETLAKWPNYLTRYYNSNSFELMFPFMLKNCPVSEQFDVAIRLKFTALLGALVTALQKIKRDYQVLTCKMASRIINLSELNEPTKNEAVIFAHVISCYTQAQLTEELMDNLKNNPRMSVSYFIWLPIEVQSILLANNVTLLHWRLYTVLSHATTQRTFELMFLVKNSEQVLELLQEAIGEGYSHLIEKLFTNSRNFELILNHLRPEHRSKAIELLSSEGCLKKIQKHPTLAKRISGVFIENNQINLTSEWGELRPQAGSDTWTILLYFILSKKELRNPTEMKWRINFALTNMTLADKTQMLKDFYIHHILSKVGVEGLISVLSEQDDPKVIREVLKQTYLKILAPDDELKMFQTELLHVKTRDVRELLKELITQKDPLAPYLFKLMVSALPENQRLHVIQELNQELKQDLSQDELIKPIMVELLSADDFNLLQNGTHLEASSSLNRHGLFSDKFNLKREPSDEEYLFDYGKKSRDDGANSLG